MAKESEEGLRLTSRDVFFFRAGVRQGVGLVDSPLNDDQRQERADLYWSDADGNYDDKHAEEVLLAWARLSSQTKAGWKPANR